MRQETALRGRPRDVENTQQQRTHMPDDQRAMRDMRGWLKDVKPYIRATDRYLGNFITVVVSNTCTCYTKLLVLWYD